MIEDMRGQTDSSSIGFASAPRKNNPTAGALVDMHNDIAGFKRGKLSVKGKLDEFTKIAAQQLKIDLRKKVSERSESEKDDAMQKIEQASAIAKSIMEGKSIADAFGTKTEGGGTKLLKPSDVYIGEPRRVGGRDVSKIASSPSKATAAMVGKFGMRGAQFGNSVSDDERSVHARHLVESLADLADVTGLKPQDLALKPDRPDGHSIGDMVVVNDKNASDKERQSKNGDVAHVTAKSKGKYTVQFDDGSKADYDDGHVESPALGLAVGARGRSGASAHYEGSTKVINMTRANGVGTLAHEWGHAFDHEFGKGRYLSEQYGNDPKHKVMDAVNKAFYDSGYVNRLSQAIRDADEHGVLTKDKSYWTATKEVFARSFERYIQHKLTQQGKENTYLSGLPGEHRLPSHDAYVKLWPTAEEAAKMAPAFDALLAHYRKEKYGNEKPQEFSRSHAIAYFSGNSLNSAVERLTALSFSLRNAS